MDVLDDRTTQTCKLRFLPRIGQPKVMHVESMPVLEREKPMLKIQTAMLDITAMELAEQKVRESQGHMQQIAAKLLTAQDDERRRIARDLHDGYCQRLAAVLVEISLLQKRQLAASAQHLQPVKATLSKLLADLRDLSHDLHPSQTTSVALDESLRTLLADFMEKTKTKTTLYTPSRSVHLPAVVNTTLYRITQEGLANIQKHAKAKRVTVSLDYVPNGIELLIKDDGRGFDPETVPGSHHLGLTSMRERAAQLGGKLTITSKPYEGATLCIRIPLAEP